MSTTHSAQETEGAAARFVAGFAPQSEGAVVIGLSGELGSGKTTFVKGAARALGVEGHVTSPTFVIMKAYPLVSAVHSKGFKNLIHIDAYRLEDARELAALGFNDILEDNKNLIFIEWPERVHGVLPADATTISFESNDESTRTISH